jgi:hypothetical protein
VSASGLVVAACCAAAIAGLGAGSAPAGRDGQPRVTNRCPTDPLPLRRSDLRRFGLALAPPRGVERVGTHRVDYRDARAKAGFPTFCTRYVRTVCPAGVATRVIARRADVTVGYPRVNWSASLSYSVFLVARTPRGLVGWAQMH